MQDKFATKLFLWKYALLKRRTLPYLRTLLANQFLSRDELEALSWRRMQALLAYAFARVPYYQQRWSQLGLDPQDLRHPEDCRHIPVLTREELRTRFTDLISLDARLRDLRVITTGGSTGTPVKVYHEKSIPRAAIGWRMMGWWGLSPSADCGLVYRQANPGRLARIMERLAQWPGKRILLNASCMDGDSIARFLGEFNELSPQLVHGYVGAVDHLASHILEHGIQIKKPHAVWVTSSPLTSVQEARIQEAFQAPVYDQYGCCEVYWLAGQCPCKKGLHVFQDVRRVEFLREDGMPTEAGEPGDVAVTDLENYAFPLIRYLNGDRGHFLAHECDCGVTLPLMGKIKGRVSDMLTLPGRKCVSGEFVTTLFDSCPDAVRQFQVVQQKLDSVKLNIVPNRARSGWQEDVARVKQDLCRVLGEQVQLEVVEHEALAHDRGKFRYVINQVGAEQGKGPRLDGANQCV